MINLSLISDDKPLTPDYVMISDLITPNMYWLVMINLSLISDDKPLTPKHVWLVMINLSLISDDKPLTD